MRNSSHIPLPSFLRPSALPAPRRPSRASPSLLRPSVIPAPLRPSRPPPSFPRQPVIPAPAVLRPAVPAPRRHSCAPPSFLRPSVIPAPLRHSCTPPSFLRQPVIPAPLRHSCVGRNPRDRSTWLHASTADVPPNPPNAAAWRWSAVEHLGSAQGPSDRLDSCLRRASPWLEQGNDRGRGGSEAGGGRMADGESGALSVAKVSLRGSGWHGLVGSA